MILSTTVLALAFALGSIFLVAAIAKFLDLNGTREALINFGVPTNLAEPFSVLLPILETAIAAGLVLPFATLWSSLAALIVLAVFTVTIGFSIQRGETHECHCFGQLYSRPLGWPTLLRNVIFAALAVFVFWQLLRNPNPPAVTVAERLGVSTAQLIGGELLGLVLVGVASAIVHSRLARRKASTEKEPKQYGLPIDSPAPAFELEAYRGPRQSLADLLSRGKPLMLVFSNPKCGPCAALFLEVGHWQRRYGDQITIAIISEGTVKDNFVNVARNGLENVLLQSAREVAEQYNSTVTPVAIVISAGGKIASEGAPGSESIRELMRRFVIDDNLDTDPSLLSSAVAPATEFVREGQL